MVDDKLKSNNISQHFDSFEDYKNNAIHAVVGGFIPTHFIKKSVLVNGNDSIRNKIYIHQLSNLEIEYLFKEFETTDIILNNSESYGCLGLPCDINDYKIMKPKDILFNQNNIVSKKDKSSYARIYPHSAHKCIGDLIKNFYQYIYVDGTGYIWTDNEDIHKRQFMYERLKVNFHEIVGDSYGLLKSIMQILVDIKNDNVSNSSELLNIEDLLNKVILSEKELLK